MKRMDNDLLTLDKIIFVWDSHFPSFSKGAILLLRKKNSGWVGSSNAYNCLFTLHKNHLWPNFAYSVGGWVLKW